jgi:hypothetical protein
MAAQGVFIGLGDNKPSDALAAVPFNAFVKNFG